MLDMITEGLSKTGIMIDVLRSCVSDFCVYLLKDDKVNNDEFTVSGNWSD